MSKNNGASSGYCLGDGSGYGLGDGDDLDYGDDYDWNYKRYLFSLEILGSSNTSQESPCFS